MTAPRYGIFILLLALLPATGRSQSEDRVYWMSTLEVSSGNLAAYHAFAEHELLPLLEKYGYTMVAMWQSTPGEFEDITIVMVAEFPGLVAYNRARRRLTASAEWKEVNAAFERLVKWRKTRFLTTAPYAGMMRHADASPPDTLSSPPLAQPSRADQAIAADVSDAGSAPEMAGGAAASAVATLASAASAPPGEWFDPARTRTVGTPMVPEVFDAERIDRSLYDLKAIRVVRPPRLDGFLDDPAWRRAPAATGFRQLIPDEGRLDTQRTEVRVLYDERNLYVGVMCYDTEPRKIVGTEMRRDQNIDDDDTFEMTIAPYGDEGDSYYFITNPLGARRDILIGPGVQSFNPDWNGIWSCYAKRHSRGWSAEIAIPFKTFRFKEEQEQNWSINFGRAVQRTRGTAHWVPLSRRVGFIGFFRFAKGGRLVGLKGIKPGRAVEVLPYTVFGTLGKRSLAGGRERLHYGVERNAGADIKVGVTAGITADITVNPDFAQIEADDEVVNLSRFEFRFNEKRPFFLEGSSLFQFGRGFFFAASPVPIFFSRRIGTQLFDGSTVRILHGEKITGKAGGTNFGVLNVQTEETPWAFTNARVVTVQDTTAMADGSLRFTPRDTLSVSRIPQLEPETNWNVFRVKQNLFARSTIGLLGLMKEPEDTPDGRVRLPGFRLSRAHYNRVVGMDAVVQFDRSQHEFELLLARSWLPAAELTRRLAGDSTAVHQTARDWAGAVTHTWRNSWFNISSGYTDIRAGFFSDVGFIRRRDIRRANGSLGITKLLRKGGIRTLGSPFGGLVSGDWITNHRGGFFDAGQVESWNVRATPSIEFENGVFVNFRWNRAFDRLSGRTPIAGVDFPAGGYTFDRISGGLSTDRGKRVSAALNFTRGDFYNARLRNLSARMTLKPTNQALIGLEVENNRIERPPTPQDAANKLSAFDERWIGRLRLNYAFTTELFVSAFAQLNANRSTPGGPLRVRTVVSNLLFAYTLQQGHSFVIAYNQFSDDAPNLRGDRLLRSASQTVVAKFSYLFNI